MTLPMIPAPTPPAARLPHRTGSPTATVQLDQIQSELPLLVFLGEVNRRALIHLVLRDLPAAHTAEALPAGAELLLALDNDAGHDHVVVTGDCVLWLDSWKHGGRLYAAGPDGDTARRLADDLIARLRPDVVPGRVRVEFADSGTGSRHLEIDARDWAEIAHLYPVPVARAVSGLVEYQPRDGDPRLLLWHGRPGTGKTTAVRSLLHAWRDWTRPVVISDPGPLLADGRYLRRILLDADDDEDGWRLIVIEDAEELIRARDGGALVSKLLNLADGLLGQGLRCLFLLTTNQTVDLVHPALVRPGRCLSLLEFGPLPPDQAARIAGRAVHRPTTLAEALSREVEVVTSPDRLGGYL